MLRADDVRHYQRIVVPLKGTMRLLEEIDALIGVHGGCPFPYLTEEGAHSKVERPFYFRSVYLLYLQSAPPIQSAYYETNPFSTLAVGSIFYETNPFSAPTRPHDRYEDIRYILEMLP